jgi:hypothetical protein
MRFAYCALRALPHREPVGYWIARSSRAMTLFLCVGASDDAYASFAFFSGKLRTGLPVAA